MTLALLAVLLLALFAAEARSRRLLAALALPRRSVRRLLPDLAAVAAVALLLWPAPPPSAPTAGGPALALAVDLSASMAALDGAPDRLAQARAELRALVAGLPQGRFALLPFAGEAALQVPLTGDREAILFFIDRLAPGHLAAPGSAPEEAVLAAREALAGAAGERAVVLFSDGERTLPEPPPPLPAGIPVFAVPLGDAAGSPVLRDGEPRRGGDGAPLLTRPDRDRLARIAAATGGELLEGGVAPLLARWPAAAPDGGGAPWGALLAALLLALRHAPALPRRWRPLPLLLLCLPAACGDGGEGRSLFLQGARLHRAGDPAGGAERFAEAATLLEGEARAAALHNCGTLRLAAGDPRGAIAPLEEALLLRPGAEDARVNLVLALRALGEEAPGVGDGEAGTGKGEGGMSREEALQLLESVRPDRQAPAASTRPARSRPLERDW